ncbi:MAG TPA: CoA transferase [Xanthobacteraceae bacterium]|jgi:crotonobetainyl-CoA:carnitine CoA-transferase CaiB-like acyl-CoA transferase
MTTSLPLQGITVLELGHSVAAPFAGQILGDLGADVIKVEKRDGGDDARQWAPPYWHGMSALFQSYNRNKRSITVDLRDDDQRTRLKKFIIERVDAVVQNLRPGLAEELGLDAATLRRSKPELIYATIGAFGASGPYKSRPGYDPLMQAFGGLMSVTGEPGRPPVRVGTSIIDMAAGMWAVIGILSALFVHAQSKRGCVINTSLYETALAWMGHHAATFQASLQVPERQGSGVAQIAPYRAYNTTDGFIVVAAGNDKLFTLFADVLNLPQLASDPRFCSNPDRVRNQVELNRIIEEAVAQFSTAALQQELDRAGVPNAPVQNVDQVLTHAQTKALGILQDSPDGKITLIGSPLSFDGARPSFRLAPPELGAQTAEIMGIGEKPMRKART